MQNNLNENMEVTNKLLLEMIKHQKSSMKNLIKVFIVTIIGYTALLITMVIGFFVYESQFETIEGQYETYEYDQEVDGEGEINNVTGNLYKDNATHNEEKSDE